MLNYILPIGASAIALLQLAKDWGAHQTTSRRATLLILIILIGIGTAINNYYSGQKAAKQHDKDAQQIAGLQKAVETANQNQQANTKQFVDAFGNLSQKVSDLQTQVTTEKLQSKLATVQTELQKTQKALAPGPKAELSFSFVPFDNPPPPQKIVLVTQKALPINTSDGTVHIEFTMVNLSNVDALDISMNVQICDDCKYAKEPQGFSKLQGMRETQRFQHFDTIHSREQTQTMTLDVVPPPLIPNFVVGFQYRCHTCIVPEDASRGQVHIIR